MNKKIKLGLLFGVPVLIGAYLIYRQFKNPKGKIGEYVPPPTPKPEVTPAPASSPCNYPLKKGVYNCDLVKQLQWALNHIPYTSYNETTNLVKYRPLKEDGDFGAKTEAVLIDFWKGTATIDDYSKVLNQEDMNVILAYVVEDPAAFQAAENPYVVQQPPAPEPVINPFPTF